MAPTQPFLVVLEPTRRVGGVLGFVLPGFTGFAGLPACAGFLPRCLSRCGEYARSHSSPALRRSSTRPPCSAARLSIRTRSGSFHDVNPTALSWPVSPPPQRV